MSTQNYSVYRPRHCFTLYIAIKRTVPMSTQKLLRVWPQHCFTLYIATKRTVPMSTPKTAPCMTTTLFHVWHSHQDNSAYCQPKSCSVYWPPHCFTLDIAIKRTLLSVPNYSVYWPRHCFTFDMAIKRTVPMSTQKPFRVLTTTLLHTWRSHQENPTVSSNYTVYQPRHCVSPDTFRHSRRLSERRQTAVHYTCLKSCGYWRPTLQVCCSFGTKLVFTMISDFEQSVGSMWKPVSCDHLHLCLDLTRLDLTWLGHLQTESGYERKWDSTH